MSKDFCLVFFRTFITAGMAFHAQHSLLLFRQLLACPFYLGQCWVPSAGPSYCDALPTTLSFYTLRQVLAKSPGSRWPPIFSQPASAWVLRSQTWTTRTSLISLIMPVINLKILYLQFLPIQHLWRQFLGSCVAWFSPLSWDFVLQSVPQSGRTSFLLSLWWVAVSFWGTQDVGASPCEHFHSVPSGCHTPGMDRFKHRSPARAKRCARSMPEIQHHGGWLTSHRAGTHPWPLLLTCPHWAVCPPSDVRSPQRLLNA